MRVFFSSLRQTLCGVGVALLVAIALSFVAHFWIGAGLHPETIFVADWLAPLLGSFCGAFSVTRRTTNSSLVNGWRVGLALVVLWFFAFAFLAARFRFADWPTQVFGALNVSHLLAWSATIGFALGGAFLSARWKNHRAPFLLTLIIGAILPCAMQLSHWRNRASQPDIATSTTLSRGVSLTTLPPTPDGTTLRLLQFDLSQRPDLRFGITDLDSDDATPFDDKNTSWLGQSLHRVLDIVQNRVGVQENVLCLVNGGFFGAKNSWTAFHEAPIVFDGKLRYDTHTLEHDWPEQAGALTIQKSGARFQFGFVRQLTPQNAPLFQTALGGVRGLILDSKAQTLKPGMGGTQLRCSRTSVGWSKDSSVFYVLSVRDMDGEAASLQQRAQQKRGVGTPVGGWDVAQVQRFWQKMNVPNAVLFDGGESTQLVYKQSDGNHQFISSAYQLSRTFGYWNGRPLRAYLPLLPPEPNHGGVLNYFTVALQK